MTTATPEVSLDELQAALADLPAPIAPAPAPMVATTPIGPVDLGVGKTTIITAEPNHAQEASPRANPLNVKAFVDPDLLRKDVDINMMDLDNEVRRQSGTYLHYAQDAARAKAQAKRIKVTAEILESKLYALHREALVGAGGKVTEAMVEAAVKNDRRYYEMKQKVIDAELHADLASSAAFSMEQRKDMLVQLTADRRKEREGDLRMSAAKDAVDVARKDVLSLLASQNQTSAVSASAAA